MKRTIRTGLTSTAVLAVAGGVLAATVGTAAASFPSTAWQPDPNALGTLAFYNSAGQQITSGTNASHMFDYAVASTAHAGPTSNIVFANPQVGANPGTWPKHADESSPSSDSSAPPPIGTSTTPIAETDSGGANLAVAAGGFVANTQAGYVNVYQVRVFTSGSGGSGAGSYWDADVLLNPSNNSWTELDGTAVSSTTTNVAGSPASVTQGAPFSVSATVTMADGSNPAGSVAFTSGSTSLGSTSTFGSGGVATVSVSAATSSSLAQGSDPITATFTPSSSGSVSYSGSTGSGSETVTAPATATTTTLTVGGGNLSAGQSSTLSGAVTPSGASGTVQFFDNGSSTPISGLSGSGVTGGNTVAVSGGTAYNVTLTGGFTAGAHSVVAQFTSSSPSTFSNSASGPQAFSTANAAGTSCASEGSNPTSGCTDTQTITGTIPPGTLSISTPYTATNPLNVGTLALSSDGTYWTKTATFKCITVTDATSGGSPFVASALANTLNLVPGTTVGTFPAGSFTTINSENVGLTSLGASPATPACPDGTTPVNTYTKAITPTNNAAATGVVPTDAGSAGLGGTTTHTVLTGTSGGDGTATYDGTLTLNAPTSTRNGQYSGTIVFTVSD